MVRVATEADIPALAASLARAFLDDPVSMFSNPRERTRERRLRWYFTGRLRTLVGEELCFCTQDRTGAALWAPPDRWQPPPREAIRLVRMTNHRTPLFLAGVARIDKAHPKGPHYYLGVLGVAPEAQGRGLGGALMAPMLERCDREGVGAYLESSKERNVAFYGRHGFRVTGELTFPRGPRLWLMWRDPR